MGHFPMSENPERFVDYLLPMLDRIGGDQALETIGQPLAVSETAGPEQRA